MRRLWDVRYPHRSETKSPCVGDAIPKCGLKGSTKKRGGESPCLDDVIPNRRSNVTQQREEHPTLVIEILHGLSTQLWCIVILLKKQQ